MDVVSLLIYRAMSGSGGQTPVATDVSYDNTTSGLLADNVQNAIDELSSEKISISEKGSSGGVAELNENGIILTSQLPSYVDDVLEFNTFNDFPQEGESGKIYVDLLTNKTYRWSGSAYVEISESLALGETSSTAYRGDRGKIAYDHSQLTSGNPHNVTKSQVGLGNVDNTSDLNKPISIATQTALDAKVEEDDVEEIIYDVFNDTTVEGNPISFKVITGTEKAKSCEVTMLPIQDLRGYDKPWPAGAGKNKYSVLAGDDSWGDNGSATHSGTDGILTINTITTGTSGVYQHGDNVTKRLANFLSTHTGTYTLSLYAKASENDCDFLFGIQNLQEQVSNLSTSWNRYSFVLELDGTTKTITFYNRSGKAISVDIKDVQIEAGSTATSYAPYENICPISGWDGLNLTRTGKNACPQSSATTTSSGALNLSSVGTFGKVKSGLTYTFSFTPLEVNTLGLQLRLNNVSGGIKGWSANTLVVNQRETYTFTATEDGELNFYSQNNCFTASAKVFDNIQLELGSTATAYEPYQGETITIQLGQTVYYGVLDAVNGVLKILGKVVDLGDVDYTYSNNMFRFRPSDGIISGDVDADADNFMCSIYTPQSNKVINVSNLENLKCAKTSSPTYCSYYFRDDNYTTVEDFKTAMAGQTFFYELATPTPIELIGQEVVLNKGDNILLTDGDNIKLVASQIPSVTEIIDDNNISENHTFSSSKIDEFTEEKTYEILNDLTSDITKVGNPISVNMKFGNVLNKCNLTMNPIQDLHGYNAPWMGGNGKNKIGSTLTYIKSANTSGTWSGNNYTLNGVTFAVLVDNDNNVTGIKVTGTASDRTDFKVGVPDLVTGTDYIVNGCPANGSDSTYRLTCLFNTNASAHDRGSGSITFTATGYEGAYCYIRIADGYSITTDGLTYYPMVRLATEIDATFAPYSNNCSISGRDNTFVTVCGKNIFDKNARDVNKGFMDNSIIRRNGSIAEHTTYYISEYMLLKPNTYYTLTGLTGDNVGNDLYDVNKEFVRAIPNNGETTRTFLTADNECYIRCSVHKTQGIDILQLEEGSTATNYEEYQGKTETITFPEIIYGGTDEIISGIGESTYGIVDIGEVNWEYSNSVFSVAKSEIGMKNGTDTDVQFISDIYPRGGSNTDHVVYHTTQFLRILDSNYTDLTTFKTAMAGHKICFTLETPNIVTTSPETIILNKGYNVISADADGMSIKYTEMITIDDVKNIINDAIGSILNTEY